MELFRSIRNSFLKKELYLKTVVSTNAGEYWRSLDTELLWFCKKSKLEYVNTDFLVLCDTIKWTLNKPSKTTNICCLQRFLLVNLRLFFLVSFVFFTEKTFYGSGSWSTRKARYLLVFRQRQLQHCLEISGPFVL